ncbi:hypothetical protein DC522_30535 [Microvirga sp. KLBC 81]|nr:hypothetical protein DC522_30535 [Microvirga sp. KLBC 81]
MCHLLCELFLRLRAVGLTQGTSCELPLTQAKLAEATGLTLVHLNRMVQELRAANLVVLKSRTLTIPNLEALMSAALFNPNYLHLDRAGSLVDVARDHKASNLAPAIACSLVQGDPHEHR